jgi:hypothetical protein
LGGKEASIDVGLWWDVPGVDAPFIVYANFREAPQELLHFEFEGGGGRVRCAKLGSKTRLYVVPGQDFDLASEVDFLLDELQRQVA